MTAKTPVLLTVLALLAGCAGTGAALSERTVPPPETDNPAATVARLLAQADAAQATPERLGKLVAALDALGARPLAPPADTATDPVARWRQAARMAPAPPYRGRVLGPAYKAGKLDPGATVRLPQLFDGGRAARVAVATPDRGPLDFMVLDREEKPVCPPARSRNRECSWTPLFSGRFEIVVSNASGSAAGYYLVID